MLLLFFPALQDLPAQIRMHDCTITAVACISGRKSASGDRVLTASAISANFFVLSCACKNAASCLVMCTLPCSYNTYNQHYKEVQCFQQQVEPLLVKYGVNFVFFGEHFPDVEFAGQNRSS